MAAQMAGKAARILFRIALTLLRDERYTCNIAYKRALREVILGHRAALERQSAPRAQGSATAWCIAPSCRADCGRDMRFAIRAKYEKLVDYLQQSFAKQARQ